MGHPCGRTVQYVLVSNERGDAKSQSVNEVPILIFRTWWVVAILFGNLKN